jgi:hypothetical protein
MTATSLSLVEPDMEISPIRLSPGSVFARKHSQRLAMRIVLRIIGAVVLLLVCLGVLVLRAPTLTQYYRFRHRSTEYYAKLTRAGIRSFGQQSRA